LFIFVTFLYILHGFYFYFTVLHLRNMLSAECNSHSCC